ncbi:MAG: protein kinase [Myxococcota bacterium]
MTKETPTPATGVMLGRYRVESELGRGGMGVVYACMDEPLSRRVAVKTLSAGLLGRDREARMLRFQREVKALSQLDHAGILHIYDAGEADDPVVGWVLYYAMELIEGETLSERLIRCGAMDPGAAASIVAKCGEALGSAHERGIVHRDVKPANIFIARRGRVVVADFGVCKIEGGMEITRKDQMVGTPSYLAPEQILGLPVDARTDVFALGALLYVLITNSALRPQLDRAGLSRLAATDDAANRARAIRNVPAGLPEIIAKALSRDPVDRYADGTALAEALEPFCGRVPEPFEGPEAPVAAAARPALTGNTHSSAFTDAGTNSVDGGPSMPTQTAAVVGGDTAVDDRPMPTEIQSDPGSEVLPDVVNESDGIRPALTPAANTPVAIPRPVSESSGRKTRELETSNPRRAPNPAIEDQATQVGNPAAPTGPTSDAKAAPVRSRTPPSTAVPEAASSPRHAPAPNTTTTPVAARILSALQQGAEAFLTLPRAQQAAAVSLGVVLVSVTLAVALVRSRPPAAAATDTPTPAPAATPAPAPAPAPPAACVTSSNANAKEARALLEKAAALEKKGKHKDALPGYEKAVKADPTSWEAHLGLARGMDRSGLADKARAHWQCVAFLHPGSPEAEIAAKALESGPGK